MKKKRQICTLDTHSSDAQVSPHLQVSARRFPGGKTLSGPGKSLQKATILRGPGECPPRFSKTRTSIPSTITKTQGNKETRMIPAETAPQIARYSL